jgi:hypothetical protein
MVRKYLGSNALNLDAEDAREEGGEKMGRLNGANKLAEISTSMLEVEMTRWSHIQSASECMFEDKPITASRIARKRYASQLSLSMCCMIPERVVNSLRQSVRGQR